jgi:hypothetical protein
MRWLPWVFVVLILFCTAAIGGEFSGRLYAITGFEPDPFHVDVKTFTNIAYTQSNWTLSLSAEFNEENFTRLALDVEGSIGALDVFSIIGFRPVYPEDGFRPYWNAIVTAPFGGMNLYAIATISNGVFYNNAEGGHWYAPGEIGAGMRLGGWGDIGTTAVYLEACFNMDYSFLVSPIYYWLYGFDEFTSDFRGVVREDDFYGWHDWYTQDSWTKPQNPTCSLPWSRMDILLVSPFACMDVWALAAFNCDEGFESLQLYAEHLDLGINWLELGVIGIQFETGMKEIALTFNPVVNDVFCIKPYFSMSSPEAISGISLNALTLNYEVSPGITLKAGEKFTSNDWNNYVSRVEKRWGGWTAWGEIAPWHPNLRDHGWDDVWNDDYEEYIAIEVNADICCGSPAGFFVYNWFDMEQTDAFMDWAETVIGLRMGVGTGRTLILNVFMQADGLDKFVLGLDMTW